MIKLIVGIVLLILILLSANYIFVEQFTCDSTTIRPFIERPNDDTFQSVEDCCQDIFSGANSLNKKLYEMEDGFDDKLNYDNSHALLLTFCNQNKNQSPVHPLKTMQ